MPQFLGMEYSAASGAVSVRSEFVDTTETLSDQAVRYGDGQKFIFRITLEPNRNIARLKSHYARHGLVLPFDAPAPQELPLSLWGPPGTAVRAAAAQADADRVTLTADAEIDILDGAYVAFAGHRKIYQIGQTVALSARPAQVPITPRLREAVAASAVALAPLARVRYSPTAPPPGNYDDFGMARPVLELIEVT